VLVAAAALTISSSGAASAAGSSQQPNTGIAAATVTRSAAGVTASMHVGTHHPRVNRPWYLKFTVTRGGHAVKAGVSYEYLFGGHVVAKRSHYNFTGSFSDTFRFPSSAVGYPLTFRAVIVSGKAKINLDYAVQVSK
jgi:hypothetical protein